MLENYSVHAVAAAVGGFFRELPEPLLTWDMYLEFIRAMGEGREGGGGWGGLPSWPSYIFFFSLVLIRPSLGQIEISFGVWEGCVNLYDFQYISRVQIRGSSLHLSSVLS